MTLPESITLARATAFLNDYALLMQYHSAEQGVTDERRLTLYRALFVTYRDIIGIKDPQPGNHVSDGLKLGGAVVAARAFVVSAAE
jgi:hypothetical protein